MALDTLLIEILACPVDHGPLLYFADEDLLFNPRTSTAFAVVDDIPVLLPDEGTVVDDAERDRLMAKSSTAIETGQGPGTAR